MAKSSRSSSKKQNNRRKAATIFGPAELARDERLSAKLLDLAKQPKPEASRDVTMEINENDANEAEANVDDNAMEVDSKEPSKASTGKKRVEKRKLKKSSLVFKKYSDRLAAKRKNKTKGP